MIAAAGWRAWAGSDQFEPYLG